MPPAAASAARRAPLVRPRPVAVRWDRLARVALLITFAFVLALYVGPARTYFSTLRAAHQRSAELRSAESEHARLLGRRRALREPASLEAEARRLGMVRQGEKSFVIQLGSTRGNGTG